MKGRNAKGSIRENLIKQRLKGEKSNYKRLKISSEKEYTNKSVSINLLILMFRNYNLY